MYNTVYFEISGICNAKCPWCVNGRGSLKSYPSRFIPPEEFRSAIKRLFDMSLINSNSLINLYNFGEPLLHPSLNEILQILVDFNLRYTLSTNASQFLNLDPKLLGNLQQFFISIPGFSQKSYDKIHGFDFEKILKNMDLWIHLVGSDKIQIQFHVYQFNLDEIEYAARYFNQRGVKLFPYLAYFNDYYLAKSYLDHNLTQDILENASKQLLLYYVDDILSASINNYQCPQQTILTIDEYCDVLTCCLISKADPDYSIGSLFSLSAREIELNKCNQDICKECLKKGISQWINSIQRPVFLQNFEN
jgi:MoaA/NifB/PqqE/SkfB family radical SAM enzyme